MPATRISTIKRKPTPQLIAASRSSRLSSTIRDERLDDENSTSEVTSRTIATTASSKPKSETDRGKYIV